MMAFALSLRECSGGQFDFVLGLQSALTRQYVNSDSGFEVSLVRATAHVVSRHEVIDD